MKVKTALSSGFCAPDECGGGPSQYTANPGGQAMPEQANLGMALKHASFSLVQIYY